jgi:hypothetical protein
MKSQIVILKNCLTMFVGGTFIINPGESPPFDIFHNTRNERWQGTKGFKIGRYYHWQGLIWRGIHPTCQRTTNKNQDGGGPK